MERHTWGCAREQGRGSVGREEEKKRDENEEAGLR